MSSAVGQGCSLHEQPQLKVREPHLKRTLFMGGRDGTEATVDRYQTVRKDVYILHANLVLFRRVSLFATYYVCNSSEQQLKQHLIIAWMN